MAILKKIGIIFLRISISIILLIFLFKQVDVKSLLDIVKKADKSLLFFSFFTSFFIYFFCFFRWKMLLNAVGIRLPLSRLLSPFAGGIFFNLFFPSTIGGDFVRSADLAMHTKKTKEVVATVLLDRLSGYIGLVAVALLAFLWGRKLIQEKIIMQSLFALTVLTGVLIFILLILFNGSIYSKINKLLHSPNGGKLRTTIESIHQEMHYFRKHKKIIFNNLLLSFIIQALSPLSGYIISLSLGLKLNIAYFSIFLPIIGAVTLLPISVGGLGLRDALTIYFFTKVGISKDLSFAMSLLGFFFIAVYAGIGGLIYVFTLHHRRV